MLSLNSLINGQVDSSKYWFNYRHMSNAISLHNEIRRLGISKEHIILLSGIGSACDPRNSCPGSLFNKKVDTSFPTNSDIFSSNINIDFAGESVSVNSLMALLTGRNFDSDLSGQLKSTEESNIIFFITGHGGDEFFKFQDFEEISSSHFASAFGEMHAKKRFKNILFIVDTCQASTLLNKVKTPAVTAISSSAREENSYAYITNDDIGVSVIDRFSFSLFTFLQRLDLSAPGSDQWTSGRKNEDAVTVHDLFSQFSPRFLKSTPVAFESGDDTSSMQELRLREFFDASGKVEVVRHRRRLEGSGDLSAGEPRSIGIDRAHNAVETFLALQELVSLDLAGDEGSCCFGIETDGRVEQMYSPPGGEPGARGKIHSVNFNEKWWGIVLP